MPSITASLLPQALPAGRHPVKRDRRIGLLLFGILLLCYVYFPPRWGDWNENVRMDLTLAIVDHGTLQIDRYYGNTGDYATYGGHFYGGKAPGTSLLAVPAYYVFRSIASRLQAHGILERAGDTGAFVATLRDGRAGLLPDRLYFAAALYAATFSVVSLPSAGLGVVLYYFLGMLLPQTMPRALLVLAYGLATIALPYSSVLYGHQIAASLLFVSFVILYGVRHGQRDRRSLYGAGALMGLSMLVEFTVAIPLILLCAYVVCRRARDIIPLATAAVPFGLVLAWYNTAVFGNPFADPYQHLPRFPEALGHGVVGFGWPSLTALWGITFSPYRGLFWLSPFLLLAVPGFWALRRVPRWRAETLLWVAIVAIQMTVISAWCDWRGGSAIGPRHLIPVIPFLMPAVAFWFGASQRRRVRAAGWTLVGLSCVLVWTSSVTGQSFPTTRVRNPLVEFSWPQLQAGDVTRNLGMLAGLRSWWSLLPLLIAVAASVWLMQRTALVGRIGSTNVTTGGSGVPRGPERR
jgi:hypothetical protein